MTARAALAYYTARIIRRRPAAADRELDELIRAARAALPGVLFPPPDHAAPAVLTGAAGEWACGGCGAGYFGTPPGTGRCPGCPPPGAAA